MKERRELQRFSLSLPVRLLYENSEGSRRQASATTRDVSSDGAFLLCGDELPLGTRIEVELRLSESPTEPRQWTWRHGRVRVGATVLRKEGGGMAVVFDKRPKMRSASLL